MQGLGGGPRPTDAANPPFVEEFFEVAYAGPRAGVPIASKPAISVTRTIHSPCITCKPSSSITLGSTHDKSSPSLRRCSIGSPFGQGSLAIWYHVGR